MQKFFVAYYSVVNTEHQKHLISFSYIFKIKKKHYLCKNLVNFALGITFPGNYVFYFFIFIISRRAEPVHLQAPIVLEKV